MKFGSLFSGIGGLDLGLERAGLEVRWQVEIDPFCQKVLAKHWPTVKRYGDITTLSGRELEPVDLLCGGFPCQPVSVAGKRKGVNDERWLWPEFARLLRILRPRYVLIENVPGLLRLGMDEVLKDLAEIGYDAEWEIISASAFGAPHKRNRVFLVAYSRCAHGEQRAKEQRGYGEGLQSEPERSGETPRQSLSFAQSVYAQRSNGRESIFQTRERALRGCLSSAGGTVWDTEPNVGRMVARSPARVDRLRGLGNAVVPQVAEWVGRQIVAFDTKVVSALVGK